MGKSTGPRTPRGKARSSQNAAKHWIESGRILPEEQRDAAILRSGFTEDFKPQGLIEQEVIDDLTLNRLIKRRIDLAFTREFSKATIEKTIKLLENDERSVTQYWLRISDSWGRDRAEREQAERLRPDSCIAALEGLKRRIGERGPQPQDLGVLRAAYGDQPTEHGALAMHLLIPVVEEQTVQNNTPQNTGQEDLKKEILEVLQTEIELQKDREQLARDVSAIESASDLQEPPRPALETLLRYRAANTREFKDLLDCLERIRRLRRSAD
jgi:hypothetical protein